MTKKGRRAHGEGSIYRRKDGRWVARLYVTDAAGRLKPVYRYSKTEQEALNALREPSRQQEEGVQFTSKDTTLAKNLSQWLDAIRRKLTITMPT